MTRLAHHCVNSIAAGAIALDYWSGWFAAPKWLWIFAVVYFDAVQSTIQPGYGEWSGLRWGEEGYDQ